MYIRGLFVSSQTMAALALSRMIYVGLEQRRPCSSCIAVRIVFTWKRAKLLTRSRSQHMSILPMSAQIVVKSATLVGIVGAVITGQWSFLQEHLIGNRGDDLRTEQSRSAMPRTSTSQQLGVPVAQTAVAA